MSTNTSKARGRNLVILNQAANYLTVGFANAFNRRFDSVTLITGSVHVQGEKLGDDIRVHTINRWHERPTRKKALSYALGLLRMWWLLMTRYRHHEVLFVSVPPMGYLLNLILPHRFSMVIWDVYPDTLRITGMPESHPVYRIWAWLNRRSFRKAYRLFTISEVMADALSKYVDRERLIIQPIWSIFQGDERIPVDRNRFLTEHDLGKRFIVQYSGNIGLTHNVELLVDIAERLQDRPDILFQIIGRGPREPYIRRLVDERGLSNVQMLPFQSDEMFPHSLSAADLGVVILNDRVSQGSVPSKAFNLMSFGIPSLYVSSPDSQLARYAEKYGHARCLTHEQLDDIGDFITKVAARTDLREAMSERSTIAAEDFRRDNADRFATAYFQEPVKAT
ncbi:glycosyltransferase family 4 protein [Wenzhouxiangella sp. EGI_FJ10305]|uniref:glycosyltransferase family 4 protein n=1 Tax=Wenzhouxiangella sp. EGI_FJ10305 TaxID=3243768 RepID=UPI0035DF6EEA